MKTATVSPEEFQAAINRIRTGLATEYDADVIIAIITELDEEVEYLLDEVRKVKQQLNTGGGVYIP